MDPAKAEFLSLFISVHLRPSFAFGFWVELCVRAAQSPGPGLLVMGPKREGPWNMVITAGELKKRKTSDEQ
ncbi:MAG: hypothetical protein HYZ13_07765 [Acidobacteria bacterium]|nr:hypothetical protein [Acidobacteriota bacterium]